MDKPSILITGASGFIGTALCERLALDGFAVRRAGRLATTQHAKNYFHIEDFTRDRAWRDALQGISVVVHLAARTHMRADRGMQALGAYRAINVDATSALARQAAASGVRRLIFMSSIKVNGEATFGTPFSERDVPAPQDAYGTTKWEAENALRDIAGATSLETVILRPPMVYGPGVKANFLRLLNVVTRGIPLPFASIRNRRSLVYVGNLVDAIVACLDTPAASGQTFLVSDAEDVSTPGLIRKLACALSRPPRLLPCPVALLRAAATLVGKRDVVLRLTGSLELDSSRIQQTLGWRPRFTLDQGLSHTAQWYDRVRQ